MPQTKKKNGRSKNKGRFALRPELRSSLLNFTEADYARVNKADLFKMQQNLVTFALHFDFAAATDAAGTYSVNLQDSPASAAGWANFVALWSEYRTLCLKVDFDPTVSVGGNTVREFAPMGSAVDYTTGTVPTTMNGLAQSESFLEFPGQRRWSRVALMQSATDSGFIPTASPASTKNIHILSLGNTINMNIGRINVILLVQFRGLKDS